MTMKRKKTAKKRGVSIKAEKLGYLRSALKQSEATLKKHIENVLQQVVPEYGELLEENAVLKAQTADLLNDLNRRVDDPESPYRWKDGRGKAWAPEEMTEEHLRNAVTYITRKLAGGLLNVVYLDNLTYLVDGLHHLLKECKKRGYRI